MTKLNSFCLKILNYFKSRSILFYIFWISFLVGEATLHILSNIKGCIVLPSVKDEYFKSNIPSCDVIERTFVEVCMLICFLTLVAYCFWYAFKCFRYFYRLGFKR